MKPVLQALLLAEKVYSLEGGGKAIVNTIHSIEVQSRTAENAESGKLSGGFAGPPWAYISLTDVCAGTQITLQFINLTKNIVYFEQRIKIETANRLGTTEIISGLPLLGRFITEDAVFAFEIVCEGEVIGSHRILGSVTSED